MKVLVKLPHYSAKGHIPAVAKTVDDARRLIEPGFEYVTEMDEVKIFIARAHNRSAGWSNIPLIDVFCKFAIQLTSLEHTFRFARN